MPARPNRKCSKHQIIVQGPCPRCRVERAAREATRKRKRTHYNSREYRATSAQVRARAMLCWLCGEGAISGDPWQADHYIPHDVGSPLLPAHRSCNARRGDRDADPHEAWLRYARMIRDPVIEALGWAA